MTEYVILVDKHDQELGTEEKIKAHEKALCHRAFSVFILNDERKILLQKRQSNKYHCGGLWTNTCCSHPRPNEDTKTAAERRLYEEMGIKTELTYIDKFHYIAEFENGLTENEVDHVFYGTVHDDNFTVNPDEVSDKKWVSFEELSNLLNQYPDQFTPWLKPALVILKQTLL